MAQKRSLIFTVNVSRARRRKRSLAGTCSAHAELSAIGNVLHELVHAYVGQWKVSRITDNELDIVFAESVEARVPAGLDRPVKSAAIEKRLHGRNKRDGFDEMVGMLSHYKIAKWPIVSVVPFYCAPRREAFVKPTTAKGILAYLEIEEPQYTPRPSWEFYSAYRKLLQQIKREIDPSLSPNYAALTGFMMSVM